MNPENNNEKIEFKVVMVTLADEMGANIESKKNLLKAKYEALIEYDIMDIRRGVTWLIKNRTLTLPLMPTVREIIDAIRIVTDVPDSESIATMECDKVLNFLTVYGARKTFESDNKITQYLMTKVWKYNAGWALNVKENDLKWFRKDFVARWIKMAESPSSFENQIGVNLAKRIKLDIKKIV